MALTNPKIFGLNIKSELSDVKNKNAALINLGLNPLDLEIIKGSANEGMTRYDWFSFSRLKEPIHKRLSRFESECRIFDSILVERAGTDQTLFGNLDINGSLSGSSIRYRFLDGTNPGKLADISTSRVSAWSSSASPVLDTSPISYGSEISIRQPNTNKGALKFGTQAGGVSGPRLQTTLQPTPKIFDSEIPTSLIECTINGQTVKLFCHERYTSYL